MNPGPDRRKRAGREARMPKTDPDRGMIEQRVWLAALGKHPGWNDHLDDIGLDTDRLVAVKRHLYVDGIGGLINAGTWEAMSEEDRDEGYAHSFFWRQPDGMVIGRMWSSSDGKGRRKYPMIVCAMTRGLPFAFVAGPLLERLRRLEVKCRESSLAGEVIGAVDATRSEVTELASHTPALTGERVAGGGTMGALGELARCGTTGEDAVGLKRVLYQVQREMTAYLRPDGSATATRSRSVEIRGQHIRVPSSRGTVGPGDEQEVMGLWVRALLTRVDPLAPMLLMTKDGRPWVDIIVGELGPTPLSCLQGGTASHPYTSDIPFTIEGEVAEQIDSSIEASRQGQVDETDPCFIDVPQERLAPFLRPRRPENKARAESQKSPLLLWIIIAVVALLAIVIVLRLWSGGRAGDGSDPGAVAAITEPGDERDPPGGAPGTSEAGLSGPSSEADGVEAAPEETGSPVVASAEREGRLDRFRAWCESFAGFYRPFVEQVDLRAIAEDPQLRAGLLSAIREAEEAGGAIDPLAMTPGRFRSVETLAASPPDAALEEGFAPVIENGQALIEAIRGVLSPDRWPTHASLSSLVDQAAAAGREAPASVRSLLEGLSSSDGGIVAASTAAICGLGVPIRAAEGMIARIDTLRSAIENDAPETVSTAYLALNVFPDRPGTDAAAWFGAITERCDRLETLGEALANASDSLLPRVDRGLLAERLGGQRIQGFAGLEAWLEAVEDRSLYLLDPAADPRRGLVDEAGIAGLRSTLSELVSEQENGETREIEGLLEAIEGSSREIGGLAWNEATRQRIEEESEAVLRLTAAVSDRIDAEQRRRALRAAEFVAQLGSMDSVTETGSSAIDAAWREARDAAVQRFDLDGDVVSLSRTIDECRERLRRIEERLPVAPVDRAEWGGAAEVVLAAVREEREARLREEIGAEKGEFVADAYAHWLEGIGDAGRCLGLIRTGFRSWAWGGQAEQASRDWLGSWVASRVDLGETEPALSRYIDALTDDSGGVCAEICRGDDEAPATLLAAWLRHGPGPAATDSAMDNLRADTEIVGRVRERLGDAPPDRRDEIEAELVKVGTVRWRRAASHASVADFLRLVEFADVMRIEVDSLPVNDRFDLFVARMRSVIEDGGELNRDLLLDTVNTLIGSGVEETARDWLARLADELAAREGREVDYREIGPGRAGWDVQPFDGGRVLVYSWAGGDERRQLTFRLIESPGTDAFYLGDTEAPAWLLTEYALASPARGVILSTLPEDWDPLPDTRPGPHVWTWGRQRSGRAVRLARTWVNRNDSEERPYYPEGSADRVGRPEPESPIQRVSDEAAMVIAASVGCRLPSEAEWRAAYRSIGSPGASDAFNLRDAAFDAQRSHTASLGAGIAVTWPERQSFAEGLEGVPGGPDAPAFSWTDGTLWFRAVGSGADRPLRHLVGNVGEFVLDGLNDSSLLGDRGGGTDAVARSIAGRSVVLGVIGASALSPPSVAPDRAVVPPTDTGRLGYTDVGFRLAFSPGVEVPLVVLLDELLADAPFLRGN